MNKEKVKVGYLTQEEFDKQMGWTADDAKEYLKLAVRDFKKDGNYELFLHCIMRAVKWVGVTEVARRAGLTRQGIYDALIREGANPGFKTLTSILAVLGVKTTFVVGEAPRYDSHNRSRVGHYAALN